MKQLTMPTPFLNQSPNRLVQLIILLTLLWAALPLFPELPTSVMGLFIILWCVRIVLWKWYHARIPNLIIILIASFVIGFIWITIGTIVGQGGGVALLIFMALMKSYESNQSRDWQILLLTLFLVIGGAALFNQSIWMSIWLLIALFNMSICLATLNEITFTHTIKQAAMLLVLAILPMIILFIATPRFNEPLWRIPQSTVQRAKTGMSESMRPGSISELVQDDGLAFNAIFTTQKHQPQSAQLYWRVMVLPYLIGGEWRAAPPMQGDRSHVTLPEGSTPFSYEIILQDEHGWIPALDQPININTQRLRSEMGHVVRVKRSREGLQRISLQAALTPFLHEQLSRYSKEVYTRLPKDLNPKTQVLAQTLYQQSHGETAIFIDNTLRYFQNKSFSYTLTPPRTTDSHTTDFFLFDAQAGFCEDYTDAFVKIMRMAGVPARVVIGYQGGEPFEQGKFWQVRHQDAHAWAEVWIENIQSWMRVDPTAAVSTVRIENGIAAALPENERNTFITSNTWLTRMGRTLQFQWQRWIVNFDANRQSNLFQTFGFSTVGIISIVLILLIGGSISLIPILLWWFRQHQQNQSPLEDGFLQLKQTLFYGQYTPQEIATMGPLDCIEHFKKHPHYSPKLENLIRKYIHWVYNKTPYPTRQQQQQWRKLVKKQLNKISTKQKSR